MMDRKSKDGGMTEKQLQDFLDKGGEIQYFKYGERSEQVEHSGGFYGRKKKKKEDE